MLTRPLRLWPDYGFGLDDLGFVLKWIFYFGGWGIQSSDPVRPTHPNTPKNPDDESGQDNFSCTLIIALKN